MVAWSKLSCACVMSTVHGRVDQQSRDCCWIAVVAELQERTKQTKQAWRQEWNQWVARECIRHSTVCCCAQQGHNRESIRRDASSVAALCGTHSHSSGRVQFQIAAQLTQRIQTARLLRHNDNQQPTTNHRTAIRRTQASTVLASRPVTADRYQPLCHVPPASGLTS